jgi:hypothetical protein
MLENMHRILEKIDALNQSFKGMVPKKARRQQHTFAAAVNEATKSPVSAGISTSPAAGIVTEINGEIRTLVDK